MIYFPFLVYYRSLSEQKNFLLIPTKDVLVLVFFLLSKGNPHISISSRPRH